MTKILFEEHGLQLEVVIKDQNIWLSKKEMAELFNTNEWEIGKLINTVLKEEVEEFSSIALFPEDNEKYYNLNVILSIGYRINNQIGIKFREWANRVLKEQLLKQEIR